MGHRRHGTAAVETLDYHLFVVCTYSVYESSWDRLERATRRSAAGSTAPTIRRT